MERETMTDLMIETWDKAGLTDSLLIDRLKDWANMLEKRVAEFDPMYRGYPWGRK